MESLNHVRIGYQDRKPLWSEGSSSGGRTSWIGGGHWWQDRERASNIFQWFWRGQNVGEWLELSLHLVPEWVLNHLRRWDHLWSPNSPIIHVVLLIRRHLYRVGVSNVVLLFVISQDVAIIRKCMFQFPWGIGNRITPPFDIILISLSSFSVIMDSLDFIDLFSLN